MRILRTKEICEALGMSRRTLYRRLQTGWKDGYGFFLDEESGKWCIKDTDLKMLIEGIQDNYFQGLHAHTKKLNKV